MEWPVGAILHRRPAILRRMAEIELSHGTAIKPGVITRRLMKSISLLAVGALLSVSPALAQMQLAGLLKPGHAVFIQLKAPAGDLHKITSTYTISDQGTLKLPMLKQEIPAAGISASTLARRVEAAYLGAGTYKAPKINVGIWPSITYPQNVVIVAAEVRNAGEFPWVKGLTLMAAITRAGGFTESAGISRVKLIRGKKETIYDLRKINPDGSNNPVLMDGDQIIVPGG
jgi:polysaccharide export outer membrane protein